MAKTGKQSNKEAVDKKQPTDEQVQSEQISAAGLDIPEVKPALIPGLPLDAVHPVEREVPLSLTKDYEINGHVLPKGTKVGSVICPPGVPLGFITRGVENGLLNYQAPVEAIAAPTEQVNGE